MGRRRIFLLLLSAALALSLAGCGQAEPPSASGTDFSSAAKEEQAIPFKREMYQLGVTLETLLEKKIVRKPYDGLKVLANGELTKKLTVKAAKFTAAAKEKITAAGGQAEEG